MNIYLSSIFKNQNWLMKIKKLNSKDYNYSEWSKIIKRY